MLVRSRMTREVITVPPSASLAEALALTRAHRIRHLPVMADGRLVGLVSDRDLRQAMPAPGGGEADQAERQRILRAVMIGEVMVPDIVTIRPDLPIEHAAKLLYEHRIGCLPVLDGDDLVGILTDTDVLRAFVELFAVQAQAARIEVRMPNRPGELARVVRLIGIDFRINITGMVVPPQTAGSSLAIMKLQTSDVEPVAEALRKMGYDVGVPGLE